MSTHFPANLLLNESDRNTTLLREFYEQHHERRNYAKAQHEQIKAAMFRQYLEANLNDQEFLGVDLGCRGGALTSKLGVINWIGCDVDRKAVEKANALGIPSVEMNIAIGVGFVSDAFNAVVMTEVLEHLAYPVITVREVHRILKKNESSVFFGSVPIDYHLSRRWKVLRGKRLSGDPTHIHHFSFTELDHLLRCYFHDVTYKPLRGTAFRYPRLPLPYNMFVTDICWVASRPKSDVPRWEIREVL